MSHRHVKFICDIRYLDGGVKTFLLEGVVTFRDARREFGSPVDHGGSHNYFKNFSSTELLLVLGSIRSSVDRTLFSNQRTHFLRIEVA